MITVWPPCLCTISTRALLDNESAYIDQELEKKYTHAQTQGWFSTPDKWIILLSNFATHLARQVHQSTHLGERKIQNLLRRTHLKVFHLKAKITEVVGRCPICHLLHVKSGVTKMDTGLPWLAKAVLQTVAAQKETQMEHYDCPDKNQESGSRKQTKWVD